MLESLHIKNYALLRDISIDFKFGFNVLTGETGAGKSILAGALALVFGCKNDFSVISDDSDECSVTAILSVDNRSQDIFDWLKSREIIYEDSLIIRRILKKPSKSTIYVNNVVVSRTDLSELSEYLIDIHSQYESITLLRPTQQRKLLDKYAGIENKVEELSKIFNTFNDLKKSYDEFLLSEKNRDREIELLKYSIDEIDKAKLKVGEDVTISAELEIASQSEKMYEIMESFLKNIGENRDGALKNLRYGLSDLEKAKNIDNKLLDYFTRLSSSFYEIEDICASVEDYYGNFSFDPDHLEFLNNRIFLIKKLKNKYGNSIEEILKYKESSFSKLEDLESFDNKKSSLEEEIKTVEKQLFTLAIEISKKRKSTAEILQKQIQEKLRPLGMKNGIFAIDINMKYNSDDKPLCSATGFDVVSFMLAANKGENLKQLQVAASGGELSRVLLAIKSVFAGSDNVNTLVFDEIDSGIGGEVALSVAERLGELAESKQILCITHLASIAAKADSHLLIKKEVINDKTNTLVLPLNSESRVKEIARMLAGDSTKETSLNHAKELLNCRR